MQARQKYQFTGGDGYAKQQEDEWDQSPEKEWYPKKKRQAVQRGIEEPEVKHEEELQDNQQWEMGNDWDEEDQMENEGEEEDGHWTGEQQAEEEYQEEDPMQAIEEEEQWYEEGEAEPMEEDQEQEEMAQQEAWEEEEQAPVPAPKLAIGKHSTPRYIPLNSGKGSMTSKGVIQGHPTPLTHPRNVINQYHSKAFGGGKGHIHPIQDPNHPVHKGLGWIQNQGKMNPQPMMAQMGEWTPPPFPPPPFPTTYRAPPFVHIPGCGMPIQFIEHGYMGGGGGRQPDISYKPQRGNRPQGKRMSPDDEEDSSNEMQDDLPEGKIVGPYNRGTKKGRVKAHKKQVWVDIGGKRHLASYWEYE